MDENIVVKAEMGGELRRFTFSRDSEYISFIAKLNAIFGTAPDTVRVMYLDDDGDWVTFSSESELAEALRVLSSQSSNVLRLKVSGPTSSCRTTRNEATQRSSPAFQMPKSTAKEAKPAPPSKPAQHRSSPAFVQAPNAGVKSETPFPLKEGMPASKPFITDELKEASPNTQTSPALRAAAPALSTYAAFKHCGVTNYKGTSFCNTKADYGATVPNSLKVPMESIIPPITAPVTVPFATFKQLGEKVNVYKNAANETGKLCISVAPQDESKLAPIGKPVTAPFATFKYQGAKMASAVPKPATPASAPMSVKAAKPVPSRKSVTQIGLEKGFINKTDIKRARNCQVAAEGVVKDISRALNDLDKEINGILRSFDSFLFGKKSKRIVGDLRKGLASTAKELRDVALGTSAPQKDGKAGIIPQMVNSFESAVDSCTLSLASVDASKEVNSLVEATVMEIAPIFDMLCDTLKPLQTMFLECSPELLLVHFTSLMAMPTELEAIVREFVNKYIRPYLDMVLAHLELSGSIAVNIDYDALIKTITQFISSLRSNQIIPLIEAFFKEFCVLVFELHQSMSNARRKRLVNGTESQQGGLMPSVNFTHLERFLDVVCDVLTEDQLCQAVRGLHTSFTNVITLFQSEAQCGKFGTLMGRLLPAVDVPSLVEKVCDNPPQQLRQLNQWAPFLATYFASLSATQPIARKDVECPAVAAPAAVPKIESPKQLLKVDVPAAPAMFPVVSSPEKNQSSLESVVKSMSAIHAEDPKPELRSVPFPCEPERAEVATPLCKAVADPESVEEVVRQICSAALAAVVEDQKKCALEDMVSSMEDSFVSCTDEPRVASHVEDVSLPDGTEVEVSSKITKTWCLRNTGNITWPTNLKLKYIGGDRMDHPEFVTVPALSPSEECHISVELVAPSTPGRYLTYWKLFSDDETSFGRRMWADIVAVPSASLEDEFVLVDDDDDAMSFTSVEDTFMYPEQMDVLESMGHTDKFANEQVLIRVSGSVDRAVRDLAELDSALQYLESTGIEDREECIHVLLKNEFDVKKTLDEILA